MANNGKREVAPLREEMPRYRTCKAKRDGSWIDNPGTALIEGEQVFVPSAFLHIKVRFNMSPM